jgi:hypothetical protein
MRFFFVGPRIFSIRPGISFGAILRIASVGGTSAANTVKLRDLIMSFVVVAVWFALIYHYVFS